MTFLPKHSEEAGRKGGIAAKNPGATKPVMSPAAQRLRGLLDAAGECVAFRPKPGHPGVCNQCGTGRALHVTPGTSRRLPWYDDDPEE